MNEVTMSTAHPWNARAERPADAAAIRSVHLAAFGRPAQEDLADALREDPAWSDGLSLGGIPQRVIRTIRGGARRLLVV